MDIFRHVRQPEGGILRALVLVSCRWLNATAEGAVAQASCLAGAGAEVALCAAPGSPVHSLAAECGLRVLPLSLDGLRFLPGALSLARLEKRWRPDFVIAHRSEDQAAAVLAGGPAKVVRVRSDIRRPRPGRLGRLVSSRTDLVVLASEFMACSGYGGGGRRPVAVVPFPVDTARFRPRGRAEGRLLVAAARMSEVKGHETLLRALAAMPGARAVIAGPPAQRTLDEMAALASSLGVGDRVEFPGRIERIEELYSRAALGVVTSLGSEAVSRTAMEMLSSGLPVLAAATNGLVDMVQDGITGLLHPPGDWRTLAAQAVWLLDNPPARAALSAGARRSMLERYSAESVGRAWMELLSDAGRWNKP